MQVGGSPFDCAGRGSTDRMRMACKRPGVRVPLAPLPGVSPGQSLLIRSSKCPARAHLQTGLGVAALGPEPGRADRQALPEFAASYQAIARRRGKKIATIAIARKLLTRAYHLLAAQATATPGMTTPHSSTAA